MGWFDRFPQTLLKTSFKWYGRRNESTLLTIHFKGYERIEVKDLLDCAVLPFFGAYSWRKMLGFFKVFRNFGFFRSVVE